MQLRHAEQNRPDAFMSASPPNESSTSPQPAGHACDRSTTAEFEAAHGLAHLFGFVLYEKSSCVLNPFVDLFYFFRVPGCRRERTLSALLKRIGREEIPVLHSFVE